MLSQSITALVTEVSAKMLPSCPAAKPLANPPAPVAKTVWRGRPRPRSSAKKIARKQS